MGLSALWAGFGRPTKSSQANCTTAQAAAFNCLALEPRMLLDGAFGATVDIIAPSQSLPQAGDMVLIEALSQVPADLPGSPVAEDLHEIAVIDARVDDIEGLIAALGPGVEIHILESGADGIDQIAGVLAGRTGIDVIHIISHGASGELQLGSSILNSASIAGVHASDLAAIGAALNEHADILVYGCNFAEGAAGIAAIEALSAATGADVAASSDATGAEDLGGDWVLEVRSGDIEAPQLAAWNWFATLASTVVNSGGGVLADRSDGLEIHVIDNGQLQVRYVSSGSAGGYLQLYEPSTTTESTALFNGLYLAVGNQVTGSDNGADGPAQNALWGEGGQTISGSGSATDPYIVTTILYSNTDGNPAYDPLTDTQVIVQTLYSVPNAYFTQRVTITPPATNTDTIKFYHTLDTFLSGGDNGPAFSLPQNLAQTNDTVNNPSLVGVRKDPGGPNDSFVAFAEAQGSMEFSHWYSDVYASAQLYGYGSGQGIQNGNDIVNSWNTNPSNDNGLGVQFTLGAINAPVTFEYHIAFGGEASIDLDADDSSGATGAAYNARYDLGSGGTIPIVDADAHISNIVGDILQVRVVLSTPQAGDALVLNSDALPSGVQVLSQTATEIILGAVGTPQSEATFDIALQALGFTTSSLSLADRSIDFTVTNELGQEGFASAGTIAVNEAPVAHDDIASVFEDVTLNGNVITDGTPNSDPDNDPLSVVQFSLDTDGNLIDETFLAGQTALIPGVGSLQIMANGDYSFIPAGEYSGPVPLVTYVLSDDNGLQDSATLSLNVAAVNDPPVIDADADNSSGSAGADFMAGFPENSAAIPVVDTDVQITDPDSMMQSATIRLTNAHGLDSLQVGTLPPGISAAVNTGLPGEITVTLTGAASAANYQLALQAVGFMTTSDNPDPAPRLIEISLSDGSNTSNIAIVTINVAPANDAPSLDLDTDDSSGASGGDYITSWTENATASPIGDADTGLADLDNSVLQSVTITLVNGLLGDVLEIGALPPGIALVGPPPGNLTADGSLTIVLDGPASAADFQSAIRAIGFASNTENPAEIQRVITIETFDGALSSNVGNAFINIIAVNDAPVTADDQNSGDENLARAGNVIIGTVLTGTGSGGADTDADADALEVISVLGGNVGVPVALAYGDITINADGSYFFSPNAAADGLAAGVIVSEAITYEVSDGNGGTAQAVLTITLQGSNDDPAAAPDIASVSEDAAITSGNVLNLAPGADSDADADALVLVSASQNGNPVLLGTPFVLAGGGLLTLNPDGSWQFAPGTAYNGLGLGETAIETVSYQIDDGNGGTATATLTLTVNGANDAPVIIDPLDPGTPANPLAAPDPLNAIADVSASDGEALTPLGVTAYVVDPEGEPLSFSLDPSAPSWLAIDPATGVLTGTPPADASQFTNTASPGIYLVTIIATDAEGAPVTTTLTLTISNLAPVAINDAAAIGEDAANASGNVLTDPLTGDADADPDSDPLVVASASQNGNPVLLGTPFVLTGGGLLTLNPDGPWQFAPGTAYNGLGLGETATETVTYQIDDGNGGTATATLTLTVNGANDAPVIIASPGSIEAVAGTPVILAAPIVSDPDTTDTLSFTTTGLPDGLSIDPYTGAISGVVDPVAFAGGPDGDGNYTVVILVSDGKGGSDTITFTLAVLPPSFAPLPPPSQGEHLPDFERPVFPPSNGETIADLVNAIDGRTNRSGIRDLSHPVSSVVHDIGHDCPVTNFSADQAISGIVGEIQAASPLDAGWPVWRGRQVDFSVNVNAGQAALRSLIVDDTAYLELRLRGQDGLFLPVRNWHVSGQGGMQLPSWVTMAADNLARITAPAGTLSVRLHLLASDGHGVPIELEIELDLRNGIISPAATPDGQVPHLLGEKLSYLRDEPAIRAAALMAALAG